MKYWVSSHLELVILKNSQFICQNNQQKIDYIFSEITGCYFHIKGMDDQCRNKLHHTIQLLFQIDCMKIDFF